MASGNISKGSILSRSESNDDNSDIDSSSGSTSSDDGQGQGVGDGNDQGGEILDYSDTEMERATMENTSTEGTSSGITEKFQPNTSNFKQLSKPLPDTGRYQVKENENSMVLCENPEDNREDQDLMVQSGPKPSYNTHISGSHDVHIGTKIIKQYHQHQHQHHHPSSEQSINRDRSLKIDDNQKCSIIDMDEKSKMEFENRNGKTLKKAYHKKMKRVQVIMEEDNIHSFDVTSEQYLPVDFSWKEVKGKKSDVKDVKARTSLPKENQARWQPHDISKDEAMTAIDQTADKNRKRGKKSDIRDVKAGTSLPEVNQARQQPHDISKDEAKTAIGQTADKNRKRAQKKKKPHPKKKSGGNPEVQDKLMEESVSRRESIEHIDKFIDNDKRLPIMIEAEAGMGKTVLLHRLALDWANNKPYMLKWKFVFLVPLRQLKNPNDTTLEDMICKDLQLLSEDESRDFKSYLKCCKGDILFLFDGLDEVDLDLNSEILSLNNNPNHTVLYTSRPLPSYQAQAKHLSDHPKFHLKLLGFSEENTEKFISIRLKDKKATAQIFEECKKHLFCNAILKVPLYTSLICLLWKKNFHKLANTATSLFNTFLKMILQLYQTREKADDTEVIFEHSPLEKTVQVNLRLILRTVSLLAYNTLHDGKVQFTEKEVDENCLTMETISNIGLFCIETAEPKFVYFRHKLFHEYFAGLHLSESESARYHLINSRFDALVVKGDIFEHAIFFAAGFSSKAYSNIVNLIDAHEEKESAFVETGKYQESMDPIDISYYEVYISESEETSLTRKILLGLKDLDIQSRPEQERKLQKDAFVMQIIFEAQMESDSFPINFNSLPVWAQSSHSLAAAYYISEATNMSKKGQEKGVASLIIIDSDESERNELECIWEDCRKNRNFTSLSLVHPRISLLKDIFQQQWVYIRELVLGSTCKNVKGPNLNSLAATMPNMEVIHLSFIPHLLCGTGNQGIVGGVSKKDISVLFGIEDEKLCGQMQREPSRLYVFVHFKIHFGREVLLRIGSRGHEQPGHRFCIFSRCKDFFMSLFSNIKHICIHDQPISTNRCLEFCKDLRSICIPIDQINSVSNADLPVGLEGLSICTFTGEHRYMFSDQEELEKFYCRNRPGPYGMLRLDLSKILPLINIKDFSLVLLNKNADNTSRCICDHTAEILIEVLDLLIAVKDSQNQLSTVTFHSQGHLTEQLVLSLTKYCEFVDSWKVAVQHEFFDKIGHDYRSEQKEESPIRQLYDCCVRFHGHSSTRRRGYHEERCTGSRTKIFKIVLKKKQTVI